MPKNRATPLNALEYLFYNNNRYLSGGIISYRTELKWQLSARCNAASIVNILKFYRFLSIKIKLTNYKAWTELKGIYVIYGTNIEINVTEIRG